MISARGLSKYYGDKKALDNVSFDILPGKVTGFVGPNGAGKSTTMRLMVGLDHPSSGEVTIDGKPFAQHAAPMSVVGALLDAKGVHPGRTARSHLRALAATHRIEKQRVEQVLEMTGLTDVAEKRVGGFSLGMGQRLGIAAALLGDPKALILDEPVNGLDPDGVMWVRHFVREQASMGKTVLLSSHLMSEMAQTADHVIVIGRGKIVADVPMEDLLEGVAPRVRVASPEATRLVSVLQAMEPSAFSGELTINLEDSNTLTVQGAAANQIGAVCLQKNIELHELTPIKGSLEDAYLSLTRTEVEYQAMAE